MDDIDARKVGYDIATLFRVIPWVFNVGDTRDPQALVAVALRDSKEFIETSRPGGRAALMRGLALNLLNSLGADPNPSALDALIREIEKQVDDAVGAQYSSEIEGDPA